MFCPRCGLKRISEETSFCSKCGFLLTTLDRLIEKGGVPDSGSKEEDQKSISPRSRGIRQGIFMLLLTLVIAPIVGLISEFALGIAPWPVGLVLFGLGLGGILRIIYALMFELKFTVGLRHERIGSTTRLETDETSANWLGAISSDLEFSQGWGRLSTSHLEPISVTDNTTKLLDRECNRDAY